jgi:aspartokinase
MKSIKGIIESITFVEDVALITLDNIPNDTNLISRIFTSIANLDINIDMISKTSPYGGNISISFTIPGGDLTKVLSLIGSFKSHIPDLVSDVSPGNVKISLYGEGMKNCPGVAAQVLSLLSSIGVELKIITTSEVDISILVSTSFISGITEMFKRELKLEPRIV